MDTPADDPTHFINISTLRTRKYRALHGKEFINAYLRDWTSRHKDEKKEYNRNYYQRQKMRAAALIDL